MSHDLRFSPRGLSVGFGLAFAVTLAGVITVGAGELSGSLHSLQGQPLAVIEASNARGEARLEVWASDLDLDGDQVQWKLPAPGVLRDRSSGETIAVVGDVAVTFVADPVVQLGFIVTAGGSPTNFTITSAVLTFADVLSAEGRATVAMTATDLDGDGVAATGTNGDSQSYQAYYNGAIPASGSTFATLGSDLSSAIPYGSVSATQDFPVSPGTSTTDESGATLGTLTSMSTQLQFSLSANDSASGSSVFAVAEPVRALKVVAEGASGRAEASVPLPVVIAQGTTTTWSLDRPTVLRDPSTGEILATLKTAEIRAAADQQVALNFSATTGSSPANFTITSASVSFPALPAAEGRAAASVTVTDIGGDGAGLTGTNGDGQMYEAFYNDVGSVAATGTTFATLLSDFSTATAYSSAAASSDFAAGVFSTTDESGGTLGSVSSVSAQFRFSTGAFESASGTSVFAVSTTIPVELQSFQVE